MTLHTLTKLSVCMCVSVSVCVSECAREIGLLHFYSFWFISIWIYSMWRWEPCGWSTHPDTVTFSFLIKLLWRYCNVLFIGSSRTCGLHPSFLWASFQCVCVCVEFSFLRMRNPLTCMSTGTISRQAPDRDAVSVHVEQHVWVEIWQPCLSLSFLLSLKLLVSFVCSMWVEWLWTINIFGNSFVCSIIGIRLRAVQQVATIFPFYLCLIIISFIHRPYFKLLIWWERSLKGRS